MTYREVIDSQGRLWEVWEVRPTEIERRQPTTNDRRSVPRDFSDRRGSFQLRLLGGMREGWLTFQCGAERRRLAPIPQGWTTLSDETLLALAMKAATVARAGLPSRVTGFGVTPPPTDVIDDA